MMNHSLERAEVVALVDIVGQQRVEVEGRLVPVPVTNKDVQKHA